VAASSSPSQDLCRRVICHAGAIWPGHRCHHCVGAVATSTLLCSGCVLTSLSLCGGYTEGMHREIQMQHHGGHSHPGECQGQAGSSARSNCSSSQKQLTNWRAEDRHCGRVQMQGHRGYSHPGELRTGMHQQNPNAAHHRNHSPSVQLCCHGGRKRAWRRGGGVRME